MKSSRIHNLITAALACVLAFTTSAVEGADPSTALGTGPLRSWNDGKAKQSVIDFVKRVSVKGGKDFVPAPERIAVFDNDGTLWAEQPLYFQLAFALDRVKALAPQRPEWKDKEPFASLLDREVEPGSAAPARHDLRDAVRAGVIHYWHPVGTCAMGSVTDADGHVLGVDGLVVADASLMPVTPRATTNIPTVVVAERIGRALAREP